MERTGRGKKHGKDGATPGHLVQLAHRTGTLLLNCDLGEGHEEVDALVMPLIDMANIACGGHAGDPQSMLRCIQLAKQHKVSIGAHPAYPDRPNFGRLTPPSLSLPSLLESLKGQLNTLKALCHSQGVAVDFIKPHGALYHDVAHEASRLQTLLEAIDAITPEAALMLQACTSPRPPAVENLLSQRVLITEAFADRAYRDDGTLVNRSEPGSVLPTAQAILAQATQLAREGTITSKNGKCLVLAAQSLCVHGDTPDAYAALKAIHTALKSSAS